MSKVFTILCQYNFINGKVYHNENGFAVSSNIWQKHCIGRDALDTSIKILKEMNLIDYENSCYYGNKDRRKRFYSINKSGFEFLLHQAEKIASEEQDKDLQLYEDFLNYTNRKDFETQYQEEQAFKEYKRQRQCGAIKVVPKEKVHPYYFSSLTEKEINENSKHINQNINNTILVVGQYFDYKGLDIALESAKLDQSIKYKFVGSGKRSNLLKEKAEELNLKNVEIIPFLNKEELYKEYQESMCLLLPSRRECWGLVINEAASFGCPIISTKECGAAIEFLDGEFLANPCDPNDLYNKIKYFMNLKDKNEYKNQLVKKTKKYTIETSVENTIYTIYN